MKTKDYRQIAQEWFKSLGVLLQNDIYTSIYCESRTVEENIFRAWLLETTHSLEQAVDLVRNHGVAVKYDNGDLELLRTVFNKAFPDDVKTKGGFMYYFASKLTPYYWGMSNTTIRPILKLSSVVEVIDETRIERSQKSNICNCEIPKPKDAYDDPDTCRDCSGRIERSQTQGEFERRMYYQGFKKDKPETVGETDMAFDLDNYADWLEVQLWNLENKVLSEKLKSQAVPTQGAGDEIEFKAFELFPKLFDGNYSVENQHKRAGFRIAHLQSHPTASPPDALDSDSRELLKVCFEELRLKMIRNQEKYGWSNEWLTSDWENECRENMMKHIQKGDPRDVAIYAMFMMYRGWSTASPVTEDVRAYAEKRAEEYAKSKSNADVFQEAHKKDFMAGFDFAQSQQTKDEK